MVVLIAWIVDQVNWRDYVVSENGEQVQRRGVLTCFKAANGYYIFFSISLLVLSQLGAALRWRILLLAHKVQIGLIDIIKLTFMGNFLSLLMPGLLGGDGVKAYLVARETERKAHVVISSFMDRLFGLGGFIIQALIMLAIIWFLEITDTSRLQAPAITAVTLIAILLGILLGALLLQRIKFPRIYQKFQKSSIYPYFKGANEAFAVYRNKGSLLYKVMGLTFFTQAIAVGSVALVGFSLDLSIEWYNYFIFVPLIIIVSSVPITPGGVGVMEELYLLYFSGFESNSEIFVLALLVRITNNISFLPGGIVVLFGPKFSKEDAMQTELKVEN